MSLLIDAGLSAKQICMRLESIGVEASSLQGIVVSHEHQDHTQGIRVLTRRLNIPLYLTSQTYERLNGKLDGAETIRHFNAGQCFSIGDIKFDPFSVPHDAADPVGFSIQYNNCRVGIALDLGYVTHLVREKLRYSHMVILESNYEPELLRTGHYPWYLKQRLQGRHGHLSNKEATKLLAELIHPELEHIILAHLSQTNNHPQVAYKQAQAMLAKSNGHKVRLSVATQHEVGPVIKLQAQAGPAS